MAKKKNAVKKGSVKQDRLERLKAELALYNVYAAKEGLPTLIVKTEKEAFIDREELRHFTRVWMMDMVTMALGRMGFREKRFETFNNFISQTVTDYDKVYEEDLKDDKELIYSRTLFERELKQYTGKFYRPEHIRYGIEEVIK